MHLPPHAVLDDLTRFLIALCPVLVALNGLLGLLLNKKMNKHDEKLNQLSKDVNGRVTELVEAEGAKAKLEQAQQMGYAPRGQQTRHDDDSVAKGVVKAAVKEAIVEVKQSAEP